MRLLKHPVSRLLIVTTVVCVEAGLFTNLPSPRVKLPDGKLRGKYVFTRGGKKIRAFLNIPYAKPPTGELRFKSPVATEGWWDEAERWAVDHPKPCVQPEERHGKPIGQEDCLYLNVYTPESASFLQDSCGHHVMDVDEMEEEETNLIPEESSPVNSTGNGKCPLLPVMVFFHGGALERGHSEPFTHEYIMDSNIVFVTVQYRLGILGFLSTGDEVLPGNLGFKDQRLALEWVRDNIEIFGGCPQKVTIIGDEAGGASVHYHLLFPPKTPTFRAGIAMSGTALSPWAFRPQAEVLHQVDILAHLSGCPMDSQEFVDCLTKKPAEEFVELLHKYKDETRGGCGVWAESIPVLGGVLENITAEDSFITANPWDMRVNLPWITGVTKKELIYTFMPYLVAKKDKLFKELDRCFDTMLPKVLGYEYSNVSQVDVSSRVRKYYFKNKHISKNIFADVVDAVSDGSVAYPVYEAVRRGGIRATWLYIFNYLGSNTYGASSMEGRIAPGRGDDLFFLFPHPLGKDVPRRNKDHDTSLSKQMVKLWTTFAETLNPTPVNQEEGVKWNPIAPTTSYLNIAQDKLNMERPFLSSRMNFWSRIDFPNRIDAKSDSSILPLSSAESSFLPFNKRNQ